MDFVDSLARSVLGISGTQVIIIAAAAVVLVGLWALIRAVLKIALHIFAVGCVTILGIILGLYIVFNVIGPGIR
jgi:hypothetical protein